MSLTSETAPLSLPRPETSGGQPRRVGVELEFSGITEQKVIDTVRTAFGGTARETGAGRWELSDSELGGFTCFLDSRPLEKLDREGLGRQLRDLARTVVPVELVTDPLQVADIARLDAVLDTLRRAGATGTRAGVLLGFGLHFNPEVVAPTLDGVLPTMTAYALIEDHIRQIADIDVSRRVLPWVDPWPRALLDRLADPDHPVTDLKGLIDIYLRLAPSRNHGLDMLPFFAHADCTRVARVMDMEQIGARPTYHWRLPDCRIDEPGWTIAGEWNRWVLVERVAGDAALLDRLKAAWRDHRASFTSMRADWASRSGRMLREAGL